MKRILGFGRALWFCFVLSCSNNGKKRSSHSFRIGVPGAKMLPFEEWLDKALIQKDSPTGKFIL